MGRFCHVCGQENVVPKESFGKLVVHFFYDITHFDGKFFDSLRYLLFRPGLLSKEHVKGRRARYLNPVRMYVFTSAIFFLIFFIVVDPKGWVNTDIDKVYTKANRVKMVEELEKELIKDKKDSANLSKKIAYLKDTSHPASFSGLNKIDQADSTQPKTFAQYDSVQKTLSPGERDGWIEKIVAKKIVYTKEFQEDPNTGLEKWLKEFLHQLPYLLFVSLPFFALILKLLYVRRRKEFFYADHAIFSIHHYILSFILLLFCFLMGTLFDLTGMEFFRIILYIFLAIWPVHLYIAMLNFYNQGWFKTFVKFIALNLLGFVTLLFLFLLFLFISLIQL
jgi:hypothetical protein